ncbi:MAG: hypothetical protein KJ062_05455 [Thermoanaerobaculia bacterium]|nr:hypothetical protein [Thermoanaerobaculia bacterium]
MPASRERPEPLDLDGLPSASSAVAEALAKNRPGPMSLPEYARFLKQFRWTEEQLRSIPLASGPRFTLDD